MRNLSRGDRGKEVLDVQTRLRGQGHELGREGVERAIGLLLGLAQSHGGLDEGTVAALTGFGECSYKVTFIVFVRKDADYYGALNTLNIEMLRRFAEGGVEFAMPTRLLLDGRGKAPL